MNENVDDGSLDEVRPGAKPCPVCGSPMRVEVKRLIEVDACPAHGVWFDGGELEKYMVAASRRSIRARRRGLEKARRDGKVSGAMWGWWSLLFD